MTDTDRQDGSHASGAAGALPLTPLWDLGSLLEVQARIWNQMLDSQRSLWAVCMPWLQGSPWLQSGTEAIEAEEAGKEPAETVDGIPDALELQARAWNHFLDANRSFWTSFGWPLAGSTPPEQQHADDAEFSRRAAARGRHAEGAGATVVRTPASAPKPRRAARKG